MKIIPKNSFIAVTFLFVACFGFFAGKESEQLKKIIFTDKAPKPLGPYCQAVLTDDLIFVSGQIAINPLTNVLDTSSIENETRQVMENISAVLNAAGSQTSHILKGTIYLTDLKNFKQVNEVYGNYFKESPAAREAVQVAALPKGAHVEISVIASH